MDAEAFAPAQLNNNTIKLLLSTFFSEIEADQNLLDPTLDSTFKTLLNSIIESDEGIREAGEILMTISEDERQWAIQEMCFKGKRDYESGLLAAKREGIADRQNPSR